MGKFPIIRRSGVTLDNAEDSREDEAAAAAVVIGDAADRDRRLLVALSRRDEGEEEEEEAERAARRSPSPGRWRGGCGSGAAARVTDRDPGGVIGPPGPWRRARIARGERRRGTCCAPSGVRDARRRRGRRPTDGGVREDVPGCPAGARLDSITAGRAEGDRLSEAPLRGPAAGPSTRGDVGAENRTLVPLVLGERAARRGGTGSSRSRLPAKIDPGGAGAGARWRPPSIGLVRRALLLGLLLATSLLCDAAALVPSSPSSSSVEEEGSAVPRNGLGDDELEIIGRSIVRGLGLQRIPDPSKANVSQAEYERAHREYLKQAQLSHGGQKLRMRRDLHVFQAAEHPRNKSSLDFSQREGHLRHSLYFPVAIPGDAADVTVEHASLRFLLQGDHGRPRDLETLVYLRTPISRRLLLRRGIPRGEPTGPRWLELDSTEAAADWLEHGLENHGLELEFLDDGRPTRREVSHATLNVFATSASGGGDRRKRSTPEDLMPLHKGRRSKCKGDNNKKCCRHELTVMFKDLKGFEFIVYPKGFDAGYCKGRCPPRYNPAHHHALLQSLLWKEDRKRVPKPCCAPSKLDQLMIVYFDENDSTKLKVSYWKNIQVLECACS